MTLPLFHDEPDAPPGHPEWLGGQACVLRGHATPLADELIASIDAIAAQAPWRHLVTPGGATMSVAMTNCGDLGWVSDRRGYRYTPQDPASGRAWPAMPATFRQLAQKAAREAGFEDFEPDACLINRYVPGTRLSLHQDRDERNHGHPIVSVSLGMSAIFLFGGHARGTRAARVPLHHGDVVVWGGVDRLRFHGIAPLEDAPHVQLGAVRLNLTFRRAG